MLSNIFFFVLGFIGMELASWFIHKYIMHGPLWFIHKTHHHPQKTFFELNDVFSLIFGSIAILLIITGAASLSPGFFVGLAISTYGMIYFVLHDVFVHRRVKWINKLNHPYFNTIKWAHKMHHKHLDKNPGESYGLLWVAKKYYKKRQNS